MEKPRFFKVILEAYTESKNVYVASEGGYDMSQDKDHKSSETGGIKKVTTGKFLKSLRLEEFELEDVELKPNQEWYELPIGKSLGKYKIPIPLNEEGRLYVEDFDIFPNNVILHQAGGAREITDWGIIHGDVKMRRYNFNDLWHNDIYHKSFTIKGEFMKLVDFSRF